MRLFKGYSPSLPPMNSYNVVAVQAPPRVAGGVSLKTVPSLADPPWAVAPYSAILSGDHAPTESEHVVELIEHFQSPAMMARKRRHFFEDRTTIGCTVERTLLINDQRAIWIDAIRSAFEAVEHM